MKRIILLFLLSAFTFQLSAEKSFAFFVGFGAAGGAEQVITKGQELGLIPKTPGGETTPQGTKQITDAETVWQAIYDCGDYDNGYAIAVDISGNVYVTGRSFSGMMGDQCLTVKYDANGNFMWKKPYCVGLGSQDGCGIAVDASQNVYVVGRTFLTLDYNYFTAKYNSDSPPGEVWLKTYASPGAAMDDYGNCIAAGKAPADSGCVFSAGFSNNGATFDFDTIKYDSDGNTVWQKFYDSGKDDRIFGIATDPSGNVYVTGWSQNDTTTFDYLTIKYNSDSPPGVAWQKRYDGGNDDRAYGIAVDPSGNVYVTGYSNNGVNLDYLTIKYDSNGDTVWKKIYNNGNNDEGKGIAVDPSGNVYVTGYSNNGTNNDYFTIKYDANGDSVWQKRFNRKDDQAYGIAVDSSNNVYVTGQSTNAIPNTDYLTIKYRQY